MTAISSATASTIGMVPGLDCSVAKLYGSPVGAFRGSQRLDRGAARRPFKDFGRFWNLQPACDPHRGLHLGRAGEGERPTVLPS